jgi:hypothetical protein
MQRCHGHDKQIHIHNGFFYLNNIYTPVAEIQSESERAGWKANAVMTMIYDPH